MIITDHFTRYVMWKKVIRL